MDNSYHSWELNTSASFNDVLTRGDDEYGFETEQNSETYVDDEISHYKFCCINCYEERVKPF